MAQHFRRRPVLAGIVAVLLVVVLIFGGRAAWRLGVRLLGPPPPPRQTDVSLIADWMSVPYIGRAYRVPEPELYRALGLPREGNRMKSLSELAEETGRSQEDTLQVIRQTVQEWQVTHPRPGRGPAVEPSPPPMPPPKPNEPGPDGTKPSGLRMPPTGGVWATAVTA
ncbi:MAG: hypothetical protein AB7P40_25130 [Chloroflexota bacterium]